MLDNTKHDIVMISQHQSMKPFLQHASQPWRSNILLVVAYLVHFTSIIIIFLHPQVEHIRLRLSFIGFHPTRVVHWTSSESSAERTWKTPKMVNSQSIEKCSMALFQEKIITQRRCWICHLIALCCVYCPCSTQSFLTGYSAVVLKDFWSPTTSSINIVYRYSTDSIDLVYSYISVLCLPF